MAKSGKDDDSGLAADTAIRLERLARLLRQTGHSEGLAPTQWEALRFLARASRFSRTPGSVARYLGTTKGTVSQSLMMLEKKGLLSRRGRGDDQRFVTLRLTDAGMALLSKDPLRPLRESLDALSGKTRRRLAKGIADVLAEEVTRRNIQSFGTCSDCRHHREGNSAASATCMKDEAPLTESETTLLCIEHVQR